MYIERGFLNALVSEKTLLKVQYFFSNQIFNFNDRNLECLPSLLNLTDFGNSIKELNLNRDNLYGE